MGKSQCNVLLVDTETTGLSSATESIIELGMCIVHFEGKKFQGIGKTLQTFIDPEEKIPEFITEINHITNDMVKDAPTYEDQNLRSQVNALCDEADYISAHNLQFDMKFLLAYSQGFEQFTADKQICTLRAVRHTYPTLSNHKLAFLRTEVLEDELAGLAKQHTLFESLQDHRALSDVLIDVALLKLIMDQGACGTKSWREFIQKIKNPPPPNKLNFGKYRGHLVTDAVKKDPRYFRWLLTQDWFKNDRADLAFWVRKLLGENR
jgi:DNA polymerase III epsilon subunit-like protein